MTIPLGTRPRSEAERLSLAKALRVAPRDVVLGFDDDGWTAACFSIAGQRVWWAGSGAPTACQSVLQRLGLPPLRIGAPPPSAGHLRADLTWALGSPTADQPGSPIPAPGAPGETLDTSSVVLPDGDNPLVTVLVCTYNRAGLIGEALASALAQTWPCEVLVVDDGSTDDTPRVLASAAGIRHVRQEPNQGKPAALERGLAEARGEAILILDDDDVLLPGAVAVLARALFAHPENVSAWADTIVFDGATGLPTAVHPASRLPDGFARRAVLQQVPAMPGATLIRTASWRAAPPRDPSLIRGQDMDLFLSLSAMGPMVTVPLPTFLYRSHDGLRGAAAGQWRKQDQATHKKRFLSYVRPVFARRYAESSPVKDRAEAHAWALGLWQRDLAAQARLELARWPGPYSLAEAWVRTTIGIHTNGRPTPGVLLVVDDGDEGALEATLARHSGAEALYVNMFVPRDPLGNVRLYWPGTYGAREPLGPWMARVMPTNTTTQPWRLALTSAPEWTPPMLSDSKMLPETPAPEAISAVAAALGWSAPNRTRPGLPRIEGPVSQLAWQARAALAAGQPAVAMGPLGQLVSQLPAWRGGWRMTAEAFTALGHQDEARVCTQRASP